LLAALLCNILQVIGIISACSKEVQLPVDGSAEGSGMGLMA
jgi:hypothetical protein